MSWVTLASLLLATAVALGAFGAHALKDRLDPYHLDIWQKAVFYHFLHALGLLATPILAKTGLIANPRLPGLLFLTGILFFSGSLYVLALTGTRWLGAITPLGGLAFIAAWILLAWQARR